MIKKYKFPVNIFVVFEKINPVVYTSNILPKNHFVCFIDKNWYYGINVFLKNEIFYNLSTLSEMSIIDTLKYNNITPQINLFNKKNRFLLFNVYYTYFAKIRLTLMVSTNSQIQSIDSIYKNSNWLEREASEMFGLNFSNKKDSRPLLLDYSRNEFPMLKDFPCEGYQDIFYNFFENKLTFVEHEFIEL